LIEPRYGGLDPLDSVADLAREGVERLPDRHRDGIHEVRPPDLHDVLERVRLGGEGVVQQP
jgi:hypothetical protein